MNRPANKQISRQVSGQKSDRKSDQRRVLLVGAQGQVGQELAKTLAELPSLGTVIAVDRRSLDLTDLDATALKVTTLQPSLIINAAAYTAVDQAESEPELAYRLNAEAPRVLAESAAKCGAALVHLSTDYVFAGSAGSPRCENDATGPVSVYGKTKLAGESAIRHALDAHIILRTAWVYGTEGKGNFVKTMLRLGKERDTLSVVSDQVGSPTWARDIATTIGQLSVRLYHPLDDSSLDDSSLDDSSLDDSSLDDSSLDDSSLDDSATGLNTALLGTYHFTNSGVASWYDFALAIFAEAARLGIPLKVKRVNPIATADYPTPATRPAYSVLSCQKIAQTLGQSPPYWRDSLRAMLKDYKETI